MEDSVGRVLSNGIGRLPAVIRASLSRKKVNFLIVGAQKCGTSALVEYLRSHPKIAFPLDRKEIHFFDNEEIFNLKVMKYPFYHSFFPQQNNAEVLGEGTPEYMYWEQAPRRIWDYNPKMKIIMILRSPIDRAFSHWNMMIARGHDTSSFWEAITTESQRSRVTLPYQHRFFSYLSRGLYTEQIRRIWHYFSPHQTLILRNKDLRYNPEETLRKVTDFLDLNPLNSFENKKIKPKNNPIKMSSDERQYLIEYFEYEIRTLERMLNWDCSDWF